MKRYVNDGMAWHGTAAAKQGCGDDDDAYLRRPLVKVIHPSSTIRPPFVHPWIPEQ
jgi:hypothetical protein